MMIRHNSDAELGEIELLSRKPPPWGLALMVLEGTMQAAKREKYSVVPSSYEALWTTTKLTVFSRWLETAV